MTIPTDGTPIKATFTSEDGQEMFGQFIIRIDSPPAQAPVINSLNPTSGPVGSNIGITGTNFGVSAGVVTVNGVTAIIVSWSATFIVITIPNTTSGNVVVTANNLTSNAVAFTITIPPAVLNILNTSPLPNGNVNTPVSIQFQVDGGTPPYDFDVIAGALPDGITLDENGLYSGIPTTIQNASFTLHVTDFNDDFVDEVFAHTIEAALPGPLIFVTQSIPGGTVGVFYSQSLQGSGGTPPYTFSVFSGTLPAGLSLAGNVIQGTPTTSGTSNFQIRLRDSAGQEAFRSFSVVIAPFIITTASPLPTAVNGQFYSVQFNASGGTPPYVWSLASGSFPSGLTLSGNTLSGTPTVNQTANFTMRVTAGAFTTTKAFTLAVVTAPAPGTRFATLSARPERFVSLGFRSLSEIQNVSMGDMSVWSVDNGLGAAKCTVPSPAGQLTTGQQLRIPIRKTTGNIICTWDVRWSNDWLKDEFGGGYNNSLGAVTHKEFQHAFSSDGFGEGALTIENQVHYHQGNAANIGSASMRFYAPYAPGFTNASVWRNIPRTGPGTGPEFFIPHSQWIRYVTEIQLSRPSTDFPEWQSVGGSTTPGVLYHKVSYWMLHPTLGPIRIFYRVPLPVSGRNGFAKWWFEVNTSVGGTMTRPGIIWFRDFIALQNYPLPSNPENDTLIFQRP